MVSYGLSLHGRCLISLISLFLPFLSKSMAMAWQLVVLGDQKVSVLEKDHSALVYSDTSE